MSSEGSTVMSWILLENHFSRRQILSQYHRWGPSSHSP